ncbi:MAG: hypothetical protein KN64_00585 [Sulfurovum sp. AS07-7]|nr:MAG: hypothetical protein KN64_00585 [Sulfurovum sp. AS07-7]
MDNILVKKDSDDGYKLVVIDGIGDNNQIPNELTKQIIKDLLLQRIKTLDVAKAKSDIQPFIKDMREIELWAKEFFVAIIENIKVK